MENTINTPKSDTTKKSKAKHNSKELFNLLHTKPMSRRMAATLIGFPDQTYMVTNQIYQWLNQGRACVIGVIKCSRSGRMVQSISTNPINFPKSDQLSLFE